MANNEMLFEALPEQKFRVKKKRNLMFSGFLLLCAVAYLISGIISADKLAWIGGVIFILTNGIMFWDHYHVKPVKIKISSTGVWMQQPEIETTVNWDEVNKAVYNGRYLDFYIASSIRETLDLKPFSEQVRPIILAEVEHYISLKGLAIKYMGIQNPAVTA